MSDDIDGVLVSAVVTTRNRRAMLLRCAASLRASARPPDELIVVDDGSTDGTKELGTGDFGFERCEVIRLAEPVMMVRARNMGARRARGSLVLFVDDDNVVDREMVGRLVEAAAANPEYGILGPSMLTLAGSRRYLDYQTVNLTTGKTRGHVDDNARGLCDSDGVPNVFMIRRACLEACGYFDESLIQTFTEPDFAFSARNRGFGCGIVKAATTYHDIPEGSSLTPRGLGGEFSQKAYCLMRNRSILVSRYGRLHQRVIYGTCFSWFWPLLYSLLMARFGRWDLIGLYWRGFANGMRYLLAGGKGPVPGPRIDWARWKERCGA